MITYDFKDINDTVGAICFQIRKDLQWTKENSDFKTLTPEDIFYRLKNLVTYKLDPKGNELLQSCKTFATGKHYGTKFLGDCDCFTIFSLTILLANGFKSSRLAIVLAGNRKNYPSHIYSLVDGQPFDLTQNFFNSERNYNFRQVLPLNEISK